MVLHVGTMKSGTTSIQSMLFRNVDRLGAQDIRPLGGRWTRQMDAITEMRRRGGQIGPAWLDLVAEAQAWPGTSVISVEALGPFLPDRIESVVTSFGDLPVDVVLTVRDINRTIPSLWQETVKNGRTWSWPEYQAAAERGRPGNPGREQAGDAGRTYWRQQDAWRIARRWAAAVGWDHLTLVTLPPPGAPRSTLTERFGRVIGCQVEELKEVEPRNTTLGATSCELVRRLNLRLEELEVEPDRAQALRKVVLAGKVLRPRRAQEQGIALAVAPWVVEASSRMVEQLRGSVVHLEGEWSDLTPVPTTGVDPSLTSQEDLVAAARDGFEGLRAQLEEDGATGLPTWSGAQDADAAVDALAQLFRAAS